MKKILIAILFLAVACLSRAADKPEQLTLQARGALVQRDPIMAQAKLEQALTLSPGLSDANVLVSMTRLLTLVNTPQGGALLDRLGFSAEGRNAYNWKSTQAVDADGHSIIPSISAAELTSFIRTNVLPTLQQSRTNLGQIQDTSYLLTLTSLEIREGLASIDYADIQMLRAFERFFEFMGYTLSSWNTDIQLTAFHDYFTNDNATIESFLADHPRLLTFANTNDLLLARDAFVAGAREYLDASALVRARPPNTVRLFNLDTGKADGEAKFRQTLIDLTNSLAAPVVLVEATNFTVSLARFFNGQTPPRAYFPKFQDNYMLLGSITDATFGGVISGLETPDVEKVWAQKFKPRIPLRANLGASRQIELTFPTIPNRNYAIEASTDLVTWMEKTVFFATSSAYTFHDDASVARIQYYRLVDLSEYIRIAGQLVDSCSYGPIAGAVISTTLDQSAAISDSEGRFELQTRTLENVSCTNLFRIAAPGFQVLSEHFCYSFSGVIVLDPSQRTAPPNDQFANSIVLTGDAPVATGTTCGATVELAEPHAFAQGSVWWKWTAPTADNYYVWVEPIRWPSSFDVDVFTGASLGTLHSLLTPETGRGFSTVAGQTYYINVFSTANPMAFHLNFVREIPGVGVTFQSPHSGDEFTSPAGIPIQVTVDSPSPIQEVSLYADDSLIARFDAAPVNFTWSNVPPGDHFLRVKAKAANGASGEDYSFIHVAPANDRFADRIVLSGSSLSTLGDNSGATREDLEPPHGESSFNKSLWWTWTAPASGEVTLSVFGNGTENASIVDVYTGSTLSALTLVAENQDGIPDGSQVSFVAEAGTTYQIAVDGSIWTWEGGRMKLNLGYRSAPTVTFDAPISGDVLMRGNPIDLTVHFADADGMIESIAFWDRSTLLKSVPLAPASSGTYTLRYAESSVRGHYELAATVLDSDGLITLRQVEFDVTGPTAPNDLFANRIPIVGGTATVTGTSDDATVEAGEPESFGESSVWWTWTAPSTGQYTINTAGTDAYIRLGIYTGNAVNALTLVKRNDYSMNPASLTFAATGGVAYQIRVGIWGGADLTLNVKPGP